MEQMIKTTAMDAVTSDVETSVPAKPPPKERSKEHTKNSRNWNALEIASGEDHLPDKSRRESWVNSLISMDVDKADEFEMESFISTLKQNRLQEKLVYVLVVASIVLLTHSVLDATWLLPYYYSISAPLLLTIRVVMYWFCKWQYFLLDFCYVGNAMFYIFIWGMPSSSEMFSVMFSLTNGPMVWAMVVYRNSLVFHSIDKVTSVFIHLVPAIMCFVIRWYPENTSRQWYAPFVKIQDPELSLIWLVGVPVGCFVIHSFLYILIVFIVLKPSEDYATSYRHFTTQETGILSKLFNLLGPSWRFVVYIFLNWLVCVVSAFASVLWYKNFIAHSIFISSMFGLTVYNGASYYMDVFGVRGFSSSK